MTPANVFWLTGFWGGGAAIALPDRTVVVTSPLEADRARETGKEVEVVVAGTWKEVPEALMKRVAKGPLVADDDSLLRGTAGVTMDPTLFLNARRTKDAGEVDKIRRASAGLDRVFREIPDNQTWEDGMAGRGGSDEDCNRGRPYTFGFRLGIEPSHSRVGGERSASTFRTDFEEVQVRRLRGRRHLLQAPRVQL